MNRICRACNTKTDENIYLKGGTVRKNCCNNNRSKNNKNIAIQNQQPKMENVNDNINNRTLILGFSICGETYLMNYILLQKQKPISIITKFINQYPTIKAQTSEENQPLENYENSPVVFDVLLVSKQASNIDLIFRRGRQNILCLNYISQNFTHLPKKSICNNSNLIVFFKQSLRDIILLLHDIE